MTSHPKETPSLSKRSSVRNASNRVHFLFYTIITLFVSYSLQTSSNASCSAFSISSHSFRPKTFLPITSSTISTTTLYQQKPPRRKNYKHQQYHYTNKHKDEAKDDDPHWYPISILQSIYNDIDTPSENENENNSNDSKYELERAQLEEISIDFIVHQIRSKLYPDYMNNSNSDSNHSHQKPKLNKKAAKLAKGHYLDLSTWNSQSDQMLEQLIAQDIPSFILDPSELKAKYSNTTNFTFSEEIHSFENIIKGGIVALQSLCILGTQVGIKGSPYSQMKRLAHLRPTNNENDSDDSNSDTFNTKGNDWKWTRDDIRQLKHDRNTKAGIQILTKMKKKQSAQGAMDILVLLGVWSRHENVDFLRSGFPTKFTEEEELAAKVASTSTHDPDQILNIRKDLRRLKVYTIDSASTSEIDDAISIEVLTDPSEPSSNANTDTNTNNIRQRYWIHIADADRWAPRGSSVIDCAKQRATSIYLPTGSYPMFPSTMSVKSMSLNANFDSCALSLGVELLPDGSIDESSIIVTSSLIRVLYRLTYDDVDEMLEEGVGYSEEWQLGALLATATRRRNYRASNGSTEGMIPNPLPQGMVSVQVPAENDIDDDDETQTEEKGDGETEIDPIISINVESTHNAGVNVSSTMSESGEEPPPSSKFAAPVSPANLLVTEMMILAGEAMGKWGQIRAKEEKEKQAKDEHNPSQSLPNSIQLPFRGQSEPEFKSRELETNYLANLKEHNVGNGYCAAWYARRFFNPVAVTVKPNRHFGMGLDCYVQWSSPIRRYSDLQVHAEVKRHLRREQINKMMKEGTPIPPEITTMDLGCFLPPEFETKQNRDDIDENDLPIDFEEGGALFRAGRPLQRNAQQYWMFEYIRRLVQQNPNEEVAFECMVLGCVDTDRDLYVIYVHELGLEHKYLSEIGPIVSGHSLWLKVATVNPRIGLLRLVVASNTKGEKRTIAAKAA